MSCTASRTCYTPLFTPRAALRRLTTLATAATPSNNAFSTSSAAEEPELVAWVRANGGSVSGVTVANLAGRDGGSGWGLTASEDLKPGRRLIELPSKCHLTYSGATSSPQLLSLIEQVPSDLWGARVALQVSGRLVLMLMSWPSDPTWGLGLGGAT